MNIRLFHDSPPAQEVAKKINDLRKKMVRTKNQPNKKPPKPRTKQTNKKSCFGLCSTWSTQVNYQSKAVEDNSTCNKDGKWIWITTAPIIPISYQQVQNVQHWSQRTCNIVALKKKITNLSATELSVFYWHMMRFIFSFLWQWHLENELLNPELCYVFWNYYPLNVSLSKWAA